MVQRDYWLRMLTEDPQLENEDLLGNPRVGATIDMGGVEH